MKLLFLLLAGCGLEYQSYTPQDQSCQNYNQTYRVASLDADVPSTLELGDVVAPVWYLDIETREGFAEACFQLKLYDLDARQYLDQNEYGRWLQPSDGLIQDQVKTGQYPLVYELRGFESINLGLELFADQHQIGRWTIQIE